MDENALRPFRTAHIRYRPNAAHPDGPKFRCGVWALNEDGEKLAQHLRFDTPGENREENGRNRMYDLAGYFAKRGYEVYVTHGRDGEDEYEPSMIDREPALPKDGPETEAKLIAKIVGIQDDDAPDNGDESDDDDRPPVALREKISRRVPDADFVKTKLCAKQRGLCASCDAFTVFGKAEIGHRKPWSWFTEEEKSAGTPHDLDNLAYQCKTCNLEQGARMTLDELRDRKMVRID